MSSKAKAVVYELVANGTMAGMDVTTMLNTYHQNLRTDRRSMRDAEAVHTIASSISEDPDNAVPTILRLVQPTADPAEVTFLQAAIAAEDVQGTAMLLAAAANHLRNVSNQPPPPATPLI